MFELWPCPFFIHVGVDMFVECGMWETFRLFPGYHDGSG